MAKVHREAKVQVQVAERVQAADGPRGVEFKSIEKNSWSCGGCGLIWQMRWQAKSCESRKHVWKFHQRYGAQAYERKAIGRAEGWNKQGQYVGVPKAVPATAKLAEVLQNAGLSPEFIGNILSQVK